MTHFSKLTFVAAIAGASLSAALALSSSAKAEASMLEKCQGGNRAVVQRCCDTWIKRNGKPLWMNETSVTCASGVSCTAWHAARSNSCRITNNDTILQTKDGKSNSRSRGQNR